MSKWKDDAASAIVRMAARRALSGDNLSLKDVTYALDQWAPLTVDEAEREMDALDESAKGPLPPEKVEAGVRYVMEQSAGVSVQMAKAAPDLLAACKAVDGACYGDVSQIDFSKLSTALELVSAALAKATGG